MTTTMTRFGMLVAMVVLAACGQEATLQQLQLDPPVTTVTQNLRANVSAMAVYSDGTRRDVTAEVQWASQDEQIASAAAGVIQAGAPGATVLTASWSGLQSTTRVDVLAATVVSLEVTTAAAAVPSGLTTTASARGLFNDGLYRDVTASVLWSTSDALLSVDAAGTVKGEAVGEAQVIATLEGASATATVRVTDAVVVALAIEGLAGEMPLGLTSSFTVWATLSDGTGLDVTTQATLSVVDPGVAAIESPTGVRVLTAGARELRGLAAGATELQATYQGASAAAPVQVTAPVLVALAINPPNGAVKSGRTYEFSAAGTFSNGDVRDVTMALTWSSGDTQIALDYSTYGLSADKAVLFARMAGTVVITAADPVTGVSATYEWTISR